MGYVVRKAMKNDSFERQWHFVDAENLVPGRLATRLCPLLMGKHRPDYSPHSDMGDYVVVVNAGKLKFTGSKYKKKIYYWHTGHVGGLKTTTPSTLDEKGKFHEVLERAVYGMLPKNKLRKRRMFFCAFSPTLTTPWVNSWAPTTRRLSSGTS